MRVFGIALCLALGGCAAMKGAGLPEPLRALPAESMAACEDIEPLQKKTFGGAVNKLVEVAGMYHACALKQAELAAWIKAGRPLGELGASGAKPRAKGE